MTRSSLIDKSEILYLQNSTEIATSLVLNEAVQTDIIRAPKGQLTRLGSVSCQALGEDIFISVKKYKVRNRPDRILDEIAVAETLLRNDEPDGMLCASLPRFTIGLSLFGQPYAILTEDFSEASKFFLINDRVELPEYIEDETDIPTEMHRRIFRALQGNIYPPALGNMTAIVAEDQRRVLIELGHVAYVDSMETGEIRDRLESYRELARIEIDSDLS